MFRIAETSARLDNLRYISAPNKRGGIMILRVIFALVLALSFTAAVGAIDEPEVATLKIGAKAPNFDLPGVDGKNWKLSDFDQSKTLVVIFTCTHCPTAQYYEERIKKLVTDYKDKGVGFVAISPN